MARMVPTNGEDTTPAARRKMCWKCQKYNVPGAEFCAFCGVQFATDNDRYQTDGRTVSDEDTTAYLSAPPPKVKGSRRGILYAFAIVVVGVLIILMMVGNAHEAVYNYEQTSVEVEEGGYIEVVYTINIRNNTLDNVWTDNFVPVIYIGNYPQEASYPETPNQKFSKGEVLIYRCTLYLSASEYSQGMSVKWSNLMDTRTFDIVRDPNMSIEHL